MTPREFSDQFDVLYNNVTSNQAPGLNEYEKSVFLTKGQSQLLNEYFNNRTDGVGGGFDGSQRRQYDFSGLIRTENLYNINAFSERVTPTEKLDRRSQVFLFPENYFLAVNEIISDTRYQYSVLPISYAEYQRLMLKPYNFPVKRGVWRLLTNKRSCNLCKEYVKTVDTFGEEIDSSTYYRILTGGTNNSRNLKITINYSFIPIESFIRTIGDAEDRIDLTPYMTEVKDITYEGSTHKHPYIALGSDVATNDTIVYSGYIGNSWKTYRMRCSTQWSSDSLTFELKIRLFGTSNLDDEQVIEAIKAGFKIYNKKSDFNIRDIVSSSTLIEELDPRIIKPGGTISNTIKVQGTNTIARIAEAMLQTDGFSMCSAPSNFYNFSSDDGKTFVTKVVQLPVAEIIGKFAGDINYELRYVKNLRPIILDNLDNYGDGDLSIDGISQITECELPEETHQEILERAVTLAKIAWQGGTMTQAAAAQRQDDSKQ